ncbi:hypothetical protein LUW77_31040 [Streptomyces radiopugnans]|nr:hypothetical protein LUW77_31040 [Streptomyces radiopugnans]
MSVARALGTSAASSSGSTSRSLVLPGVSVATYSERSPRPPPSATVSTTAGTTVVPVASTTMALSSSAAVNRDGPTATIREPTNRMSAPVMVPISGSIVRMRALVNRTGRPASFERISSRALEFQPAMSVSVALIARSSVGSG